MNAEYTEIFNITLAKNFVYISFTFSVEDLVINSGSNCTLLLNTKIKINAPYTPYKVLNLKSNKCKFSLTLIANTTVINL